MKTKDLTSQAFIATLYVVLTLGVFEPISFLPIQFRLSEVLMVLILINPKHAIGIIVGCFIANLFSPMIWDALIGTFATAVSAYFMIRTKNENLALFWPALFNGLIIGLQLYYFAGFPLLTSMFSVFVGELLVVFLAGKILLPFIRKNEALHELLS